MQGERGALSENENAGDLSAETAPHILAHFHLGMLSANFEHAREKRLEAVERAVLHLGCFMELLERYELVDADDRAYGSGKLQPAR